MKLRDFKFNEIDAKGLSIFVGGKEIAMGFTGDVLRQVPHLADYDVVSSNYYLGDTYVIRLKEPIWVNPIGDDSFHTCKEMREYNATLDKEDYEDEDSEAVSVSITKWGEDKPALVVGLFSDEAGGVLYTSCDVVFCPYCGVKLVEEEKK
jgi:hypothetical protein